MITKEALVEMFDGMHRNTSWDLSGPLLWGYFFTDSSREKLEAVAPLLESLGYRRVELFLADKDSPEEADEWWLHVEKVETHTAESLHQRNQLLYTFAEQQGLDTYDGMDVGPAPLAH